MVEAVVMPAAKRVGRGSPHHPALDYLPGEDRLANSADVEGFRARVAELVGELGAEEVDRLNVYFDTNRDRVGQKSMRCALFS